MMGGKGVGGGMFALVGAVFLALPLWQLAAIQINRLAGVTVTGVVVAADLSGGTRPGHRPVVRFTDASGAQHEVLGGIAIRRGFKSRPTRITHAIGTRVSISYAEGKPEEARFSDAKTQILLLLIAAFAAIFVALGLWLIRLDRREMRETGWTD